MQAPIRFGIVGFDHWYSAIPLAEAILTEPNAVLTGIADRSPERVAELSARFGTPGTTDLAALINSPDVDVIASFVSVDQNPEICIAAARAGKHIISIKPLALTLEEADSIREAVRAAGVVFIPGESRSRGSDQNQLIAQIVRSGRLGRIRSGSFTLSGILPSQWPGLDGPGWWGDPNRTLGGGWVDHAIYQIDRLRWLLDEDIVSISGRTANLAYPDLGVEDYGHAILETSGGAVFSIEDTWSAPAGGWRITTTIVGSEGVLHIDTSTGRFTIVDEANRTQGWTQFDCPSDYSEGVEAMLTAIADPAQAIATVDDAWDNLATCIAFYEAARTGTVIQPRRRS
jgi:predicted dehydrogenase